VASSGAQCVLTLSVARRRQFDDSHKGRINLSEFKDMMRRLKELNEKKRCVSALRRLPPLRGAGC